MDAFSDLISRIKHDRYQNEAIDIVKLISEQVRFPPRIVRKGIQEGKLQIDGKASNAYTFIYREGITVSFNKQAIHIRTPEVPNKFDEFVNAIFRSLGVHDIGKLYQNQKVALFAYVIEYFRTFGYNISELSQSKSNELIFGGLEEFCKANYPDLKGLKRKELIDQLIARRDLVYSDFEKKVSAVLNNLYDKHEKLLNDFGHLFRDRNFKHFIAPLQGNEIPFMSILEKCIRLLDQIQAAASADKYQKRAQAQEGYIEIVRNYFENKPDPVSLGFSRIINFFREKCDAMIGYTESGKAVLRITPEDRTYSLSATPVLINANLENTGTGIARRIQIEMENGTREELVDLLPPKESRKVKFRLSFLPGQDTYKVKFLLKWENDFKETKVASIADFEIKGQDQDLPWDELRRTNPYGIRIVDDPNRLYGRDQLIEDLKWNIQKNDFITSFVLYGQKRVGKSSIVRSLETLYKDAPDILFIYKAMGDLKDPDALRTFHRIGESFSAKLLNLYKAKVASDSEVIDEIKRNLIGSLGALIETIDLLHDLNPSLRFIFVLDEFDELNREFFENGEIGKTFALNIGKGLNERSYVGMILVGSENMVSKTKQGMRLNSFEIKKVDTFDKASEFSAYCRMITEPSKMCLKFASETLDLLFNYTNGNPYFTNILVGKIFKEAYEKRISFIDVEFAQGIIRHQITLMSNKDFQHFWDDGISEEAVSYEKILDRRRRVLTAFAEAKMEKNDVDVYAVKRKVRYPKRFAISEHQIEETINEYIQREILKENSGKQLTLVPLLFEEWLIGAGYYQVVAQLEDKDEILDKVLQENKLYVSDNELSEILISLDEDPKDIKRLRSFLDQFDNNSQKRTIADLLKKTVSISTSELRDHLKKARKNIWGGSIELTEGERYIRTDAEIVCFNESFTQNSVLTDLLKTTFKFTQNKAIKRIADLSNLTSETKQLLIFEPVIDCPYYYRNVISIL